ncbi:MAG: hypothetical protein M0R00_08370 [Candidatus Omnitrophica bacterium]|nr:hypothetical protein [Candidatus Omnitrophota bacterium]
MQKAAREHYNGQVSRTVRYKRAGVRIPGGESPDRENREPGSGETIGRVCIILQKEISMVTKYTKISEGREIKTVLEKEERGMLTGVRSGGA